MAVEEPRFLPRAGLQRLIDRLRNQFQQVLGPQVCDGAIVYGPLQRLQQLPIGQGDRQAPGSYRLEAAGGERCFAWANGPQALKPLLFTPEQPVWRSVRNADGQLEFLPMPAEPESLAVIGVRACDLAALALQDAHFLGDPADPWYVARREGLFLVAVHCTHPADTCFCASTGDGPTCCDGFDLALHELDEGFIIEAGSKEGATVLADLATLPVSREHWTAAQAQQAEAARTQRRHLRPAHELACLSDALMHSHWAEVGRRCLSCGNCTAVCPSCFCHRHEERPAIDGVHSAHVRSWDSCFTAAHSALHGRPVRADTAQRYRQWLIHKLCTWQDQYGRIGCVGCGRCISWCPVGIDLTAEAETVLGAAYV
ncbi:MAG: sulfite reductase subunit A [Gammaproteobacteria bacterium]|nr:MAG: sulfite reductase subunit A [Gammaproteobacteria bacterium]